MHSPERALPFRSISISPDSTNFPHDHMGAENLSCPPREQDVNQAQQGKMTARTTLRGEGIVRFCHWHGQTADQNGQQALAIAGGFRGLVSKSQQAQDASGQTCV